MHSYGFKRLQRLMLLMVATAIADVTAVFVAFIAAYLLRRLEPKPLTIDLSLAQFAGYVLTVTPVWTVIFVGCGLYSTRQSHGRVSELGRAMLAVGLGTTALIVVDYFAIGFRLFPGRKVPLYGFVLGVTLVVIGRHLVRLVLRALQSRGRGLHNIVMVGTGPVAVRIARALLTSGRGNSIVAAVSSQGAGGVFADGRPVYATIEQALASHRLRIDEIIQTDTTLSREESTRLMGLANDNGMGYRFVPDLYGVFAASSTMATISGVPLMEVRLTSLDGWATVGKRVIDFFGSLAGIVLLSPLFLIIVAAVKLSDPAGPVFYQQRRLGRAGQSIGVYKFRSMSWQYSTGPDRPYKTAEEAFVAMGRPDLVAEFAQHQKVANDPRVSTIGAVLRRTSLDELPQLVNSLLGHLSLVGPRPITEGELERYGHHQKSFLALKPGITGLWQVSGRSDLGYDQRVQLDLHYVENWSTMLDLSILARTVVTVASRRGAY